MKKFYLFCLIFYFLLSFCFYSVRAEEPQATVMETAIDILDQIPGEPAVTQTAQPSNSLHTMPQFDAPTTQPTTWVGYYDDNLSQITSESMTDQPTLPDQFPLTELDDTDLVMSDPTSDIDMNENDQSKKNFSNSVWLYAGIAIIWITALIAIIVIIKQRQKLLKGS